MPTDPELAHDSETSKNDGSDDRAFTAGDLRFAGYALDCRIERWRTAGAVPEGQWAGR